jgi:hypothetical protein
MFSATTRIGVEEAEAIIDTWMPKPLPSSENPGSGNAETNAAEEPDGQSANGEIATDASTDDAAEKKRPRGQGE